MHAWFGFVRITNARFTSISPPLLALPSISLRFHFRTLPNEEYLKKKKENNLRRDKSDVLN